MRRCWCLWVVMGSLAWGQSGAAPASKRPASSQAATPAATEQDHTQPPAPELPMDATVLTIKGFCPDQKSSAGNACQTAITRAQFEALAASIQPAMNSTVKHQLANLYPRLLVMSHEAETQGLDKQPQYQQMMAYARMQILTQALTRKLQEDSNKIPEADVSDYYQKHLELFQLYGLQRLFVPLHKQASDGAQNKNGDAKPAESPQEQSIRQAAEATEMTKLAESLCARAAAGEDFLKLQKEAFAAAGVKVAAPNTEMDKVRRTSLPAAHVAALDLKVGEISQVITDAAGHYIFRLDTKQQLSLDQVRDEVRGTLTSDRMREAMNKVQNSYTIETNEAYFQVDSGEASRPRAQSGPGKP